MLLGSCQSSPSTSATNEEGESFKPKYMRILSAGGSLAPIALLAESGMDVTKPEFWQGGFDVIDGMVKKLESL
jgi:oligoendopeptidase F